MKTTRSTPLETTDGKISCIKKAKRDRYYQYHHIRARLLNRFDHQLVENKENRMCRPTITRASSIFVPAFGENNIDYINNNCNSRVTKNEGENHKTVKSLSRSRALLDKSNHSDGVSLSVIITPESKDRSTNKSRKLRIADVQKSCVVKVHKPTVITERRRVVQFNPSVRFVEIPSHRDFPLSTKRSIWLSRREMKKNAKRNYIEFRAEGRNWRTAVEEEGMWMDRTNGELVHPVHIPGSTIEYYQNQAIEYYQQQQQQQQQQQAYMMSMDYHRQQQQYYHTYYYPSQQFI